MFALWLRLVRQDPHKERGIIVGHLPCVVMYRICTTVSTLRSFQPTVGQGAGLVSAPRRWCQSGFGWLLLVGCRPGGVSAWGWLGVCPAPQPDVSQVGARWGLGWFHVPGVGAVWCRPRAVSCWVVSASHRPCVGACGVAWCGPHVGLLCVAVQISAVSGDPGLPVVQGGILTSYQSDLLNWDRWEAGMDGESLSYRTKAGNANYKEAKANIQRTIEQQCTYNAMCILLRQNIDLAMPKRWPQMVPLAMGHPSIQRQLRHAHVHLSHQLLGIARSAQPVRHIS